MTTDGSRGNCMFSFTTNCQFVFQRGCSILHSHLWQIQFLHILSSTWYCYYFFFFIFFPSDRCAGMPHWGFNLCFFDVEHISMCLFAICISFSLKCVFMSFFHFVFFFYCCVSRVLYILYILAFCWINSLQIFSPNL